MEATMGFDGLLDPRRHLLGVTHINYRGGRAFREGRQCGIEACLICVGE